MQVVSGVNSRPFRPSLSYMTHLRPLIATTLIMGKDRGINGTAGIKTKFDGPSRESGTESMVYLRHTNGNWAWGDVDGTSSGGPTNDLSITIQPDYRICAQQDVTPYFQLKMKRS